MKATRFEARCTFVSVARSGTKSEGSRESRALAGRRAERTEIDVSGSRFGKSGMVRMCWIKSSWAFGSMSPRSRENGRVKRGTSEGNVGELLESTGCSKMKHVRWETMGVLRYSGILFYELLAIEVCTGRVAKDIEILVLSKQLKVLAEYPVHVSA